MRQVKPKIVTRESLQNMIDQAPPAKLVQIVGRALVALYERQTDQEQDSHATIVHNQQGFSGCDAEIGTSHAEFFQSRGFLTPKQMNIWLKKKENGYSRLSRYWKQLNEVAIKKATKNQTAMI
jgi:hypothetical protein